MLNKFLLNVLAIIVVATSLVSCSDNDDTRLSENARLTVRLTDAPGDYEKVNIDVQGVMINASADPESGWQELEDVNTGVYDLLELTGGLNVLLADNQLPAGELKQIRLVLGENNSVVEEGEELPLETPSAMQSGLKVQVNETLEAGYNYDIILDFDVDASIVEAGSSGIKNLKPVIRASSVATSGIIEGMVQPSEFQSMVSVVTEEGENISAFTDENGAFTLYGVPQGTYTVMVDPDASKGYNNAMAEGITVENGLTTTMEPVVLEMLAEDAANVTGVVTNEGVSFTAKMTTGEGESMQVYEAIYGANGAFTFYGIPAGDYTLEIATPEGSEVSGTSLDVTVVAGDLNTLEPITL